MFTIVETETFERLWPYYWTDQAHDEFITFITENPAVCASFILTAWLMAKSGWFLFMQKANWTQSTQRH